MRLKSVWLAIFLSALCLTANAGEGSAGLWSRFAGMAEELEAEKLELRDELISAHHGYMAALEAAMQQIAEMPDTDPNLPLAWSRAEYLLETSFRLLGSTGELEQFLKATESLKPEYPLPPPAVDPNADDLDDHDESGGLIYEGEGEDALAHPRAPEPETKETDIHLIRARAAWLRAVALEKLGRTGQASEEIAGLGLIRDWLVLGPLENDSETTSELIYGLEELYESLSDSLRYPGKNGPVQWRPFVSIDPLGRVFPEALFRSDGMKSAYLLALVHSPENRGAVLRFGSNAPATVCVNHIQERRASFAGMPDPDQEALGVWLRKGWNALVIRTSSTADGWSLAVRLTCQDGTPFPGYVAIPNQSNLSAILAKTKQAAKRSIREKHYAPPRIADLGGVTIMSEWLAKHPDDARANFYLASFLVAKRMMEGPERFDREIVFRRALELSGGNPFFSLMAARSVDSGIEGPDREENLRLVLLKMAADKGSAAALVDIGRLYLDVMRQPRRADEYADLALAVNPMSLRAGVLDYDVAVEMGWKPVADDLLERLVKRHPGAAAARLRLGRAALAKGRHRQALGEFHAILGIDAANTEALDGAVRALGMLGQTSAAVDLLVKHIERFPYDFGTRLKLAELYRVVGRDDDALAVLDAALEMAPDDTAAQSMRMDIDKETYAEGKELPAVDTSPRRAKQQLDLSPPRQPPPNGWEYLYFQVEDRMANNGSIDRTVSFALRIYTARAAAMLRHLGFWLEQDYEQGIVTMLNLVQPNGQREPFTPPPQTAGGGTSLKFYLPPLRTGMIVEAEVRIQRSRIHFLGDYFGQIAPLAQQAPVRMSRYLFTSPKDRRMFFRPANGAPEAMVVESPDGLEVTRIWEMSNLPALIPEPGSPGQHEIAPSVQVSSFGDWDEFARWYWRLIGAQYHTPPEVRALAERLGVGSDLPMEKLDNAAKWMAMNIGHREWAYGPYAYRPINARAILSRLSADGKDRTLFLCLLAREYGLKAWPVLARMRGSLFPATGSADLTLPLLDHFNHSLVMVEAPLGGDVFMDASNPYRPPGVMPSQLFGAAGMAITPASAHKVLISDNGVDACRWEDTAELEIDPDGSAIWEQTIHGFGTAAETLRRRFRNPGARPDAWTVFLSSLGLNPTATADDFGEDASSPAAALFTGRARLRHMASIEQDRVVAQVPELPGALSESGKHTFPLSLEELAALGAREQELLLPYGFRVARRITVEYPEEWQLVNPAQPFERQYAFGKAVLATESTPGTLIIDFSLEIPGHRIDAADFPAFREASALASRWLRPLLVWEKP